MVSEIETDGKSLSNSVSEIPLYNIVTDSEETLKSVTNPQIVDIAKAKLLLS